MFRLWRCCLLALLLGLRLNAQTPTGQITGVITDPSGALVPEALISVTHSGTNANRTAFANEAGVYHITALPPGLYTLKVEKPGFATQVRSGLELQVGQIARLDFSMKLGETTQVLEVAGGSPVLETEKASVGTVIENRRILELPLNGRNYLQLASLIPGATINANPSVVGQLRMGGARSEFTLSVSGQRLQFNHYTLDGLENMDVNFNSYLFLPSIDALQEFQIESGIPAAEYGRGTAQVNVSTKGGTNDLHGTLFEFLRNSALDAKNFFDRANRPIPPFKRNQFGFVLGGPVVFPRLFNGKDKLFFSVNYEGLRERKALTNLATVPLPEQRLGDFSNFRDTAGNLIRIYDPSTRVFDAAGNVVSVSQFPGNRIPAERIHRVASTVLQRYVPAPNAPGTGNNFVNNEGRESDGDQLTVRGDWVQSSTSSWFARYSWSSDFRYIPAGLPEQGNNNDVSIHQGMFGNTRVLGHDRVNDFRFGGSLIRAANIQTRAFKENVVGDLGIPDIPSRNVPLWYGIPVFVIGGFTGGFTNIGECSDCPWTGNNTYLQVKDDFSWTRGKHSFKFGGEYRRNRFNQSVPGRPRGRFTFNGQFSQDPSNAAATGSALADLLLGNMSLSESLVGAPVANYRNYHLALYFQDSWKVTPKLTFNYGVRYEDEPPWLDKHDSIVNIDYRWDHSIVPTFVRAGTGDLFGGSPAFRTPTTIPQVRDGRFGRRVNKHDRNDFAPRLGIAFSPTSKTVIRAGAGLYYVRDMGNPDFELVRNPPFSVQRAESSQRFQPNLSFDRPFSLPVSVPTFVLGQQFGEPTANVAQWSLGIQRQLTSSMSLDTSYVGSSGSHLRRMIVYNTATPGPGDIQPRRPFPQLGEVQLTAAPSHSTYHALQARLQQRFHAGFTLLSAFAWAKSIDNASAIRNAGGENLSPTNSYDLRLERGRSIFDYRRRWTNSWLYELPFGKGKPFLASATGPVNVILGGWQLGGILTLQDGMPFTAFCNPGAVPNIQNGGGSAATGANCYPDAVGIDPDLPRGQQTPEQFFNTAAFVNRGPGGPQYRFGNSARNTITGPGIINWDFSATKNFQFSEGTKLEFRTEIFNLPNHPIFGLPGSTLGTPTYGRISNTAIDSRQIQFGLKLMF